MAAMSKATLMLCGAAPPAGVRGGFGWRADLDGLVRRCGGMPIIEIDDGGIFAVQHPDDFMWSIWNNLLRAAKTA